MHSLKSSAPWWKWLVLQLRAVKVEGTDCCWWSELSLMHNIHHMLSCNNYDLSSWTTHRCSCALLVIDFSSGWFATRRRAALFWWHCQQRSDIGFIMPQDDWIQLTPSKLCTRLPHRQDILVREMCAAPPPFLDPRPASIKYDTTFSSLISLGRFSRVISSCACALCIVSWTHSSVLTRLSRSSSSPFDSVTPPPAAQPVSDSRWLPPPDSGTPPSSDSVTPSGLPGV